MKFGYLLTFLQDSVVHMFIRFQIQSDVDSFWFGVSFDIDDALFLESDTFDWHK